MTQTTANQDDTNNGHYKTKETPRDLSKVMTRSAFLHVQDALSIGKLQIWIGHYQQGEGARKTAKAYVDVEAARVVFGDLLLRAGLPEKLYPESKIEFYGGSERDGKIEARVLRFREDPAKRNPIVIEVSTGAGKRNQQGGFAPVGELSTVGIYLDVFAARKMAAEVLAQLQAFDVCNEAERRRAK